MRSDVVVVGSELDALIASLKLARGGAHVRLLMTGSSSLHYAAGGLGVLGNLNGQQLSGTPFDSIGQLQDSHPYRRVRQDRVCRFVDWFLNEVNGQSVLWRCSGRNEPAVTMAGKTVPAYALPTSSGLMADVENRRPAIIGLEGFQDFTPALCASGLAKRGIRADVVWAEAPAQGDSIRIARHLERNPSQWMRSLAKCVPAHADLIILPAVLGLGRHAELKDEIERTTRRQVVEVPTLPPSAGGMRLLERLLSALMVARVDVHHDVRGLRAELLGGQCQGLTDSKSQRYQASDFISASGGVLMGGLVVESTGQIVDPVFGFDVAQSNPLNSKSPAEVVAALHLTGVTTDTELRPTLSKSRIDNVQITGRQLPAWLPTEEQSLEGVAIATALHAADLILMENNAA